MCDHRGKDLIMRFDRPPLRSMTLALPAYNEAGAIGELVCQAADLFRGGSLAWSIVVVDDGSKDETAAIVERLAAEQPEVRLVRHPRNMGLGPAIITCLREGLGEARRLGSDPAQHLIVCMDADRTHPPATVPAMVAAADAGADLVIASRYQPGSRQIGVPPMRLLMSFGARLLFRFALNLKGVRDYTCGFRGFRGSLVAAGFDRFGDGLITRSGFACTDELLVHLAMLDPVIREVPFVLRYDRKVGESKMNLGLTIRETLRLLRSHRRQLRHRD